MDLSTLGRFHVAPGYDPAHPETWVWTDRSQDVNHSKAGDAVTITGGRGDEVSEVSPSGGVLEVDNAGGHYCTRNPLGRWYGLLARNCPARWGVISGAEAWAATTSSSWGTPDVGTSWTLSGTAADWSSAGGVGQLSQTAINQFRTAVLNGGDARNGEATFTASVPAVATGSSLVVGLVVRRTVGVNQIWFCVDFGVGGTLGARIKLDSAGSTSDLGGTPSAGTYTAGQQIKARCVWDGQDVRMRIWPASGGEPTTWTSVGTDSQCLGAGVGMQFWRVSGNTNTSPLVFSVDDLEIEAVEIEGTIPQFPVKWDPTATQSWVPIEIAGIMRRLGQGQRALRSPMYRLVTGYTTLVGYWPIEDGGAATGLTNVVSGGAAGTAAGMQFGATGPAGSAGAATFTNADSTSKIAGSFLPASATAGWQICWSLKLPSPPAAGTLQMVAWSTSSGYAWAINMTTTTYVVTVADPSGTVVLNAGTTFTGFGAPTNWTTFRVKGTQSGGTITAEFAWYEQGAGFVAGTTNTFSGTIGALKAWTANGNASMQGGAICHVFGVTTGNDNLQSYVATRAFDGYVGELAADRIGRLCAAEGVPVLVEAGKSEPMGVQPISGLLSLLRECEAADLGVLYEAGASLAYRPRTGRYNRPVTMALTIAPGGDIADPAPEPTDDDQQIRNQWTISRTNGGEATADDAAHIALNGRYPDQATINLVADDRLGEHANWRVHLGTWGEMRWPQITLNLTDRSDLLILWRGRPFGARITISGVPGQGPIGSNIDLIVEGWTQNITTVSWTVTLNCSPARPWDVAVIDAVTSRKDSYSTTLSGSLSSGATTVGISTVNPQEIWSTAGVYDLTTGGEVIGVPAAGMSAASGTGPYTQTITGAVRAKNGIFKAHNSGDQISLALPVFKAL